MGHMFPDVKNHAYKADVMLSTKFLFVELFTVARNGLRPNVKLTNALKTLELSGMHPLIPTMRQGCGKSL